MTYWPVGSVAIVVERHLSFRDVMEGELPGLAQCVPDSSLEILL